MKVRLEREQLTQAADMVKLESDHEQAVLRCAANAELEKSGVIIRLNSRKIYEQSGAGVNSS